MNTEITAADVVAFLKQQATRLATETGIDYAIIQVELNAKHNSVEWTTYVDGGKHEHATTVDGAIEKQVAAMQPSAHARRLREEAAKLLAEADALTAAPDRDEPDYDAPKPLTPMENMLQNDEHHVR